MLVWLVLALVFWPLYFVTHAEDRSYTILYYYIWLLLFGIPTWYYRNRMESLVRRWNVNGFRKFLLLGLIIIAVEEVLAALLNHLDEGFQFTLYLQRIGQFELFNLWVFTGLFMGAYLILRKISFSRQEIFYLFGCVGLFTEGVMWMLLRAPVIFFFTAPIIIFTYGLIITPAMMSLPSTPRHEMVRPLKYPLFVLSTLAIGVLFTGTLMLVARNYPWLIPPHTRNF